MGTQPQHALHRTVVVVDVSAFGQRHRVPQEEIRRGLYAALESAFEDCGLDWSATHHEDRGDGVFVLVPPDVPKSKVVDGVPHALLGRLRRYNATRTEEARIRLRIAITAGEVLQDEHGVVGDDVTLAFRLLDAGPLRDALARSTALFALIVSQRIYDDVIRQDPGMDPSSFRRVDVDVKEVHGHAWLHVPNGAVPLPEPKPGGPEHREPWKPPRARLGLAALLLLSSAVNAFAATPPAVPPCPAPVQLNVLTSAEKEEVVNRQAVDFERASRRFNPQGCKGVSVLVTRGTSDEEAAEALGRGWAADEDFTGQGTEPHVWLPDASFEVDAVSDALSRNPDVAVRLEHRRSLAESPIVLGASPDLAARIVQPGRDREFHWREVGRVAAVDTSSGSGLGAAIALAHRTLGGLDVHAPDAPLRLHKAAVSMTTATPCAGDVALVASEKTAVQNEDCVVLYPQGASVVLDHPFVAVEWTALPPNERRRRVVDRFEAHLRSDSAQSAFRRAGLRDMNGGLGSRGEPRPGRPAELVDVDDAVAVRTAWDAAAAPRVIALASDGSAGAAGLAAELQSLVGPHDRVTPVPLTGDVLKEAVRRRADVVVLLATGAIGPVDPDAGGPIRAVGVGFAGGACATSTALFKATDARGGTCHEADGPEGAQRALEGIAKTVWGRVT